MDNQLFTDRIIRPAQQIDYAFGSRTVRSLTGKTLGEMRAMRRPSDRPLLADISARLNGFLYVFGAAQEAYGRGDEAKRWFDLPWDDNRTALGALLAEQSQEQYLELVRQMEDNLREAAKANLTKKWERADGLNYLIRRILYRISDSSSR